MNRRTEYREIDRTNSENVLESTYGHDSRSNLVWQASARFPFPSWVGVVEPMAVY
jgi:hypothetical protein